jgi:hypothetical protein
MVTRHHYHVNEDLVPTREQRSPYDEQRVTLVQSSLVQSSLVQSSPVLCTMTDAGASADIEDEKTQDSWRGIGPRDVEKMFRDFWEPYPKKDSRAKARAKFESLSLVDMVRAVASVDYLLTYKQTTGKETKFIPGATVWLNQARYELWWNGPPDGFREEMERADPQYRRKRQAQAQAKLEPWQRFALSWLDTGLFDYSILSPDDEEADVVRDAIMTQRLTREDVLAGRRPEMVCV